MLKPFPMICLTAATIPVVGALLWAQSDKSPREAHSAPVAVAMQESRPAAPEGAQSKTNDAGWVGVMVEDNKGHGVRVEAVFPGGPAAFAGVRSGDVLLRVGSTELSSAKDAETAIEQLVPQHKTPVTIERNHKVARTEGHSGQPDRLPARVHGRNASTRPARSEVRRAPRSQPGGHAGRTRSPTLRAERAFGPIAERTDERSTRPAQAGGRAAEVVVNSSSRSSACSSLRESIRKLSEMTRSKTFIVALIAVAALWMSPGRSPTRFRRRHGTHRPPGRSRLLLARYAQLVLVWLSPVHEGPYQPVRFQPPLLVVVGSLRDRRILVRHQRAARQCLLGRRTEHEVPVAEERHLALGWLRTARRPSSQHQRTNRGAVRVSESRITARRPSVK